MISLPMKDRTVLDLVSSHSGVADVLAGAGITPSHLDWTLGAAMHDLAVNLASVERDIVVVESAALRQAETPAAA